MNKYPTYADVASSYQMWCEYVDRHMTEEEFNALTRDEAIQLQIDAFGIERSIAARIVESNCDVVDTMCDADEIAIETDQTWESETSTWTFTDGSRLIICNRDITAVDAERVDQ